MNQDQEKQLAEQRERWNSRASEWDRCITDPSHYANFEDGYKKFLDFEEKELSQIENVEAGVDIGCGSGVTSPMLAEKVKQIYLLDLSEKMLEEAKKKVPSAILLNASVTEIPLPDYSIDVAISRGIIVSHLPKGGPENFFDELTRIMKNGGKIIFDFMSNIDSVDFKNSSPKILFTKQQIKHELEARGFFNINFDGENENRVVRVSAIKS